MDMFYCNLSPEEQLQKLSSEMIASVRTRKKKLFTVTINPINIGNNILFVLPHVTLAGFGKDDNAKWLKETIREFGITKYALTYGYLVPTEHISRNQFKEFAQWIHRLIEIIRPRLLVLVGENVTLSFFNRKIKIENHGTQVGLFGDIPCILTLEPSYYLEHSAYENEAYKQFLRQKDWNFIKEQYQSVILDK